MFFRDADIAEHVKFAPNTIRPKHNSEMSSKTVAYINITDGLYVGSSGLT